MKPSLTALIELIKPGARTSQAAVRPLEPPVSASSPMKIEFVMHTLAHGHRRLSRGPERPDIARPIDE